MDSPIRIASCSQGSRLLSPCNSSSITTNSDTRRRRSNNSNSPEFEFWMVRNPSFPKPNLLSADELFVDGILRPLHCFHLHNPPDPQPDPEPPNSQFEEDLGPQMSHNSITAESISTPLTASKRWKDIFKKSLTTTKNQHHHKDKETENEKEKEKRKEKKKDKRSQSGAFYSSSTAELNINIWPFSRSRSARNSGIRPRMFPGSTRKVSSAPCSRSNSIGEFKTSRKWPNSPSWVGVHLGKSSPVWQVHRGSGNRSSSGKFGYLEPPTIQSDEKTIGKKKGSYRGKHHRSKTTVGEKVLNLNVPMCIGYRQHLSCRSDENNGTSIVRNSNTITNDARNGGGRNINSNSTSSNSGNLFNLRSLFTKKVY